ncbi:MAG TPA: NAD-dependent epimerase/dehydratase family protein [Solirubrobacteraceae bacterium]|jgi:dihydroflavonol-4-reductase|nr:NAD-dependent epimerase/dehydratase family protein [Solirubrobacteraceae bacterium]
MRTCVSGATGFLGAHVARALTERGDEVRVTYRDPERLAALDGIRFRRAKTDVLDYRGMRRALRGCEVLFHTAGFVGSTPTGKVWRINARAPVVVVEAAAAEGLRRVVITSTISAVGPAERGRPADETRPYPDDWLGLTYADSKHEGEEAALEAGERHGVEVVIVNPAYVLGVPVNRSLPGETSTRIVGNYLRGRLPGVIDAPMNFVDVEDAALGHLLAAERGTRGERYILGGENLGWPELIDRIARISGIHRPIVVFPPQITRLARVREALDLPGPMSAEGYELMAQDWRFSSRKAERELGYGARPLDETLRETTAWYQELIRQGAFASEDSSALAMLARGLGTASGLGLLLPVRLGQRLIGRRVLAGI